MTKEDPSSAGTVDDRIARDKALMLDQLRKTPVVEIACNKTGTGRTTFYRWKREDDAFVKAVDKALQEGWLLMNDMAESQLLTAVRDGNFAAVQYWLRHHHPSYANKIELNASMKIDETLSPEQEAAVRAALHLAGLASDSIPFPPSHEKLLRPLKERIDRPDGA